MTGLAVAGCHSGNRHPTAAADPRAAANQRAAVDPGAVADLEAAIQSIGYDRAKYHRALGDEEQQLILHMIFEAVPGGPDPGPDYDPLANPDVRGTLESQLKAGVLLYSNDEDRAKPWNFSLCYGGLFRGRAPAVIRAVGPDAADRIPVTATLTIRSGRLGTFAIGRADGSDVQLPNRDELNKDEWRVTARGATDQVD